MTCFNFSVPYNDGDHEGVNELSSYISEAIENYLLYRIPPGSFVTAVFANDLFEAFNRADVWNKIAMNDIVWWIKNNTPESCRGSYENVDNWLTNKDNVHTRFMEHVTLNILKDKKL